MWVSVSAFIALTALSAWSDPLVVGLLGEEGYIRLAGALVALALLCSGPLLWREWRRNPVEETERGEWTGKELLYAIVFCIALFISFWYLPAAYLSF